MIKDYSELVTEAAERSGLTDIATRASQYVDFAERMLSKQLRLSDMETFVTLRTDGEGVVSLPVDFQEMRLVKVAGYPIERRTFSYIEERLANEYYREYGYGGGYAIQGRVMRSFYSDTDHETFYFARIPSLEANSVNWLLEEEPELYLQAVLFQIYTAKSDLAKAQATGAYLASLLEAANTADTLKRHGAALVNLGGHTP